MQSRSTRSTVLRGVGVLAALLLAAGAISPAFGAKAVTKKKVKKIAKKQATNQINSLVPGLVTAGINAQVPPLIDADTIDQGAIPAVTMSNTDANKTLFTRGPFTISMDCSLAAGNVELELFVRTTEANSVVDDGYGNIAGDLDPADGDQYFQSFTGNPPGGESEVYYSTYYADAFFNSPSGTSFYADFSAITNFKGSDCFANGYYLDLA
ncbi:MAG: hypothetical protein ACRDH8_05130 [Actinomycetota bacterium]